MQTWEYLTGVINRTLDDSVNLVIGVHIGDQCPSLADLGQQGWELVTVEQNIAYLKRPVVPELQEPAAPKTRRGKVRGKRETT